MNSVARSITSLYVETSASASFAKCKIPSAAPVIALARPNEEALLIARLGKGDERAFNELVNKNHALIRMALRYVANRDVAEEDCSLPSRRLRR